MILPKPTMACLWNTLLLQSVYNIRRKPLFIVLSLRSTVVSQKTHTLIKWFCVNSELEAVGSGLDTVGINPVWPSGGVEPEWVVSVLTYGGLLCWGQT